MKKIIIGFIAVVVLASCGGTRFAVTTGGENLQALTKVTDGEEPSITPIGGDDGQIFICCSREKKKYYNIYKKENPFSNAMSQTSGKNYNYSPTCVRYPTELLSGVKTRK